MRRAALAAALLVFGCGGESGDLIALEITGGATDGTRRLVVTEDGRGSCDGGDLENISSERLIEAREVERELEDEASEGAEFEVRRGRREYVARTNDGTVRWGEGTPGLPEPLPKAQLLALQLERDLC